MKLVIACDPEGGIGYKNRLPWDKIQGDLPRFKKLTQNSVVVMGRNTWESLPVKPLSKRVNYVLTSDPYSLPYRVKHDLIFGFNDINILSRFNQNACIIGGAKLVEASWKYITSVHLTRTFAKYTCDSFIDLVKLVKDYSLRYEEVNVDHTYEIWTKR